jgi:alpha-tubulin suppressor-like RCC1 family protein
VQISNYDALWTWGASATNGGSAAVSNTGLVTVTGIAPSTSSQVTVTTTRTGYVDGSASVSATSLRAARTPAFATPTSTATGFTVQISNYDALWTWGASATSGGSAAVSASGLVEVTGLAPGASAQVTVTTTRTGYVDGSASVSATSIGPLSIGYSTRSFTIGTAGAQLTPTVSGGSGTKHFSYTGTLPTGVTFDQNTGAFTGPAASAWNFRATDVAAGDGFTCAVTSTGGVKCWGANGSRQLGSGDAADHSTPVDVVGTNGTGVLSGIRQVVAGAYSTCALTTTGHVKCWGSGYAGALGNNDTADHSTPVDVVGTNGTGTLGDVVQISSGYSSVCALLVTGGVTCWGYGTSGQLGNNTTTQSAIPVNVVGVGGTGTLSGINQIASGAYHVCALSGTLHVSCWGYGGNGALGNNATPSTQSSPVNVTGTGGIGMLSGATQITAGGSWSCAIVGGGHVNCWGYGSNGQLGNNATPSAQTTPVEVVGIGGAGTLSGVTQITAGRDHTCAITETAGAACWGVGVYGRLGNNATPAAQSTPVEVTAAGGTGTLSGVVQLAAGGYHTCAIVTDGAMKCWGLDNLGQLGDSGNVNMSSPVDVNRVDVPPAAGWPAVLGVTVTDDIGSWTLGHLVLAAR